MVNNEGFVDRFVTAFTFRAILYKFIIGTLIVIAFNFEGFRVNLDKGFINSTGFVEHSIAFLIEYSKVIGKDYIEH